MRFSKLHGLGNDYIYLDCRKECIKDPRRLSREISDRHFGIGSDGIILICSSKKADFRMEIYNADGSRAEMCGNGIRCFGKYVFEQGLTEKTELCVETLSGIRKLWLDVTDDVVNRVTVDMGYPVLQSDKIPIISEHTRVVREPLKVYQTMYEMTGVSMGNPHVVIYTKNVDRVDLKRLGPEIEYHGRFPRRTNVEFVEVQSRNTLKVRVWERGAGETLACGTGACAAVVSSVINDLTEREVSVKLKGGVLKVIWKESDGRVYLTGPAVHVYDGDYCLR